LLPLLLLMINSLLVLVEMLKLLQLFQMLMRVLVEVNFSWTKLPLHKVELLIN
jgi:hypothetical protein